MESTTEMLFSQANINEESSQESPKEINHVNDIPKSNEKKEVISSLESDINSKEKEKEKEEKEINYAKELDDFIFPIVNFQKPEESKNSETSISSQNKFSTVDFSSLDLNIPDYLRPKNKFSIQPMHLNQNQNQNSSQGSSGLSNLQNIFPSPSLPLQNLFNYVLKNGKVSNFIPVTFSCSIDIPRDRKSRLRTKQKEQEFFEKIIKIADVNDINEFWAVFQHLKKPNECEVGTDYHVFKKGIMPMWEDVKNKNGGKLSVLLTWKFSNIIWEEVVFNFVKGYLPSFDYINGIVISIRPKFLVLSFWVKINNKNVVEKIKNALSELLQTPSDNCFDFIPFN